MNYYYDDAPLEPGAMLAWANSQDPFAIRLIMIISDTLRYRVSDVGEVDIIAVYPHEPLDYRSPRWKRIA